MFALVNTSTRTRLPAISSLSHQALSTTSYRLCSSSSLSSSPPITSSARRYYSLQATANFRSRLITSTSPRTSTFSICTQKAGMATSNSNIVKKYALLICDIQEGFRNAIYEFPTVISTAQKLLQASQPLQIPIIATAQNASRLGNTVPEVSSHFPKTFNLLLPELDKSLFSMVLPEVLKTLKQNNITSVAICGIESHVCVLQTTLDLLKVGFEVYAIADGISSCNKEEVPIAIARMRQEGVKITTSESWLYEVMGDAGRPEFKDVLKVVKATKDSTKEGLGRLCRSSL